MSNSIKDLKENLRQARQYVVALSGDHTTGSLELLMARCAAHRFWVELETAQLNV